MNFFSNFSEQWNSRFPGSSQPPHLDCLKADHFCSLLDQKQALELEESKVCAALEELKSQLARESFIADFLHKCIQKLSAVSQVFNEIDQCDSKSSSSSGTTGRRPGSVHSPGPSVNGSSVPSHTKNPIQTTGSPFPLLPQCITSSLIHSASPLLAAAAATSSAPFLLPSSLSHFPCPDTIKLDPESEPFSGSSSFLLSASDRHSYGNLSRLASPSSFYNSTNNVSGQQNGGSSTNPFTSPANHFNHSIHSSLRAPTPFNGVGRGIDTSRLSEEIPTSEAQVAAAAVAAAFGLGLSSVRSVGASQSFPQGGHTINFGRLDNPSSPSHLPLPTLNVGGGVSDAETRTSAIGHANSTTSSTNFDGRIGEQSPLDLIGTTERPYRCGTCSRSFAVKAGLVQHMRTHTDERPYPCLHCGRAFKQKIQLTTHMRVHSGERPYGCRLCGKLFRQQSHVVQHLRTHTGEKPHKCYQCGKAFRQKYSLISHQRRMCRNRSASNPIAAGMTMWISPGVGGDTCNLVKEFSPTKCHIRPNESTNSSPSSPTAVSTNVACTAAVSVRSPFSPFLSSPTVSTTMTTITTPQISGPPNVTQFHSPSIHQSHSSHPDEDRHLNSVHGLPCNATAYRHRTDTTESGSDSHLAHFSSDRESEVDKPIRSPRTAHINAPAALGLS